jgi:hypothetical protein
MFSLQLIQREKHLERQKEKEREVEAMAAEMARKKNEGSAADLSKVKKMKKKKPPTNLCLMWRNYGVCTFVNGPGQKKGCSFNHDPEWKGTIDPSMDAIKLARLQNRTGQ